MRTYLSTVSLASMAALVTCCAHSFPAPDDREDIIDAQYTRLVRVLTSCDGIEIISGSGVRVGGHAVLTAEHVVTCPGEMKVTVRLEDVANGNESHDATVEGTAPADVARLEAPTLPKLDPVRIAVPRYGTQLCAVFARPEVGRSCGELWPGYDSSVGSLRVRFVAEHGNSGAGTWNEYGELVGILVHMRGCAGTENNGQICAAGVTALAPRRWMAAP